MKFSFVSVFAFAFALVTASQAQGADVPVFDSERWKHWGDGQAELSGYDLTYHRYGESRKGVAVAIFVTETFSSSERVKADPGRHPEDDEYPVMKLNLVQDFPTGVYDYNMMTSAFLQLSGANGRGPGTLTKSSFTSQEWCGHVYHQLLFDESAIRETAHSYFDGEGDRDATLLYPSDGVSADALLFWARGLAAPLLTAGEEVEVPFLPSLERARLDHRPLEWTRATLSRSAETKKVKVPAGTFEVITASAELVDGLRYDFEVEVAAPHRIIRWSTNRGDQAVLRGSERLAYWQLNGPGGERSLRKLGLTRGQTQPVK